MSRLIFNFNNFNPIGKKKRFVDNCQHIILQKFASQNILHGSYIKNEDLQFLVAQMVQKYEPVYKILSNPHLSAKQKQIKIELYCNTQAIYKEEKVMYAVYGLFHGITDKILQFNYLVDPKQQEKENIKFIFDTIKSTGNLEIVLIRACNKLILEKKTRITKTNLKGEFLVQFKNHFKFRYITENLDKSEERQQRFQEKYNKIDKVFSLKNPLITPVLEEIIRLGVEHKIFTNETVTIYKHSESIIFFTKKFLVQAHDTSLTLTNLPMVYKPNDWSINPITNKPERGGYLSNQKFNHLPFMNYNREGSNKTTVHEPLLKIINQLQQQLFGVDHTFLTYYKQNLIKNLDQNILEIPNFEEYVKRTQPDLHEFEIIEEKIYTRTIESVHEDYMKILNNFLLEIETLYVYSIYENTPYYIVRVNDFRGREGPKGYPMSIHGSKMARTLITMYGWDNVQKKYRFFSVNELSSHDATASGLQIIALISKDIHMLNKTNLFNKNSEDIYLYYLKKWNISKFNYLKPSFITKKNKKLVEVPQHQQKMIFLKEQRKEFKKMVFTFAYNIKADGLKQQLLKSEIFPKWEDIIFYHMLNVLRFLRFEFPQIEKLKKLMKKVNDFVLASEEKGKYLILKKDSNVTLSQHYVQQKSEEISKTYKKKRTKMTIKVDTDKPDRNKIDQSTMPNFIQSIDAQMMYDVASNALEQRIPLYCVHDCFVAPQIYENNIKVWYLEAAQKILDLNLSKEFVHNNVTNPEKVKEIETEFDSLINNKTKIKLNNLNGLKKEPFNLKDSKNGDVIKIELHKPKYLYKLKKERIKTTNKFQESISEIEFLLEKNKFNKYNALIKFDFLRMLQLAITSIQSSLFKSINEERFDIPLKYYYLEKVKLKKLDKLIDKTLLEIKKLKTIYLLK